MSNQNKTAKKRTLKPRCSLQESARQVVRAGQDFAKAMRKLRRAQIACSRCEQGPSCPLRQQFNSQVDAAIAEVNELWEMH